MAFEAPAARPLRSVYEREVQQHGAAQLLASPALLAAWAGQQGICVARAELQLLQAGRVYKLASAQCSQLRCLGRDPLWKRQTCLGARAS